MDKSTYSKKLKTYKESKEVKTATYEKKGEYFVAFYTGVQDAKVRDYVKILGGKYSPYLEHKDEEGSKISAMTKHGWLVDPKTFTVEHLNKLIEYGTDSESLLKTLQSEHINYDPDKPLVVDKQLVVNKPKDITAKDANQKEIKDNNQETKSTINNISNEITIIIKNHTIKSKVISKINDFNYITDIGEIVKTKNGWRFVDSLNIEIVFNDTVKLTDSNDSNPNVSNDSNPKIPEQATYIGTFGMNFDSLQKTLSETETPDCDED